MLEDWPTLAPRDYLRTCKRESNWPYMSYRVEKIDVHRGKRPLETNGEEDGARKTSTRSSDDLDTALSIGGNLMLTSNQSGNQRHAGDNSDSSSLIPAIGHDISVNCLSWCSRSDYGDYASLNRSFRSLIRSAELYKVRRKNGVVEHWVYFSCQLLEWEAFDPSRRRWMQIPRMDPNGCFVFSDKESLAVGTELLVFGRDFMSHIIYRYSLLTNSWSSGMSMNAPRCLESDIQYANAMAAAIPKAKDGAQLRMKLVYNQLAPLFLFLLQWMDSSCMCFFPRYFNFFHVLIYKVQFFHSDFAIFIPNLSFKQ